MKSASLATLLALALFAGGCTHRVAKPPKETGKPLSGKRRGEGISQASLHEHYFSLAHRVATAPNAPESINQDPSLLLAEALWFAGDLDFARALSLEPAEVRRSVAGYIVLDENLRTQFPRTFHLLSPYSFAQ